MCTTEATSPTDYKKCKRKSQVLKMQQKKWTYPSKKMLNVKIFPASKHPRNWGHFEKNKSKNINKRDWRRNPGQRHRKIFSKNRKKFLNLQKEMPIKVQDVNRKQNMLDQKRKYTCNTIIKTLNMQNNERILKTTREKDHVTYKGRPIRITPKFSTETLKDKRAWTDVLKFLRDYRCQPRLLFPGKIFNHHQ